MVYLKSLSRECYFATEMFICHGNVSIGIFIRHGNVSIEMWISHRNAAKPHKSLSGTRFLSLRNIYGAYT